MDRAAAPRCGGRRMILLMIISLIKDLPVKIVCTERNTDAQERYQVDHENILFVTVL